jgi:hypothetical protein
MPTPHETLLTLKDIVIRAKNNYDHAKHETYPPFLLGHKKYKANIAALGATFKSLRGQYVEEVKKVLQENHGIDPNDIVQLAEYDALYEHHKFTVLINGRIREMKAVGVGNRIVVFLDDVALGENEKASYGPSVHK